ncbi:hypothetical protein AXF42_Ash018474 [Apostasia shenzhenica]|uniref:Uncharacterized protein n=1 Tax=Apostasia shenzhenica TaxID=1088818 RepID=A0A2H9ZZH1_9ASPA|nr:hypothetical protein AXF42_Ash018474 [Apostasia shenzhenica]
MNRRERSLARKAETGMAVERLQRFLRPGALALLRDSKISARSPRSTLKSCQIAAIRLSPPASPAARAVPPPPDGAEGELIRFFVPRPCGPRLLQRKKLTAAKYVFFSPPSPDLSEFILDVITADPVTAH